MFEVKDVTREIVVEKKLLHFPVKEGAKKRLVTVAANGVPVRHFDIELADGDDPDWWAPLDVSAWSGKRLSVVVDKLHAGSKALDALQQSDTVVDSENLYCEALRPQFHFSAQRGWINDPNGLVFSNGEYHLFYQHNPYGWGWGNMHWGHATSYDLIHWQEHGEALYPDELGAMFSGSAVVDRNNTSGLGRDGKPPLVLIYTAAGSKGGQCIASSTDGRTFTKFDQNPVIKNFINGNRDPKVFWHAPTKKWVMVLYGEPESPGGEPTKEGKPAAQCTVYFVTSPNLRDWTFTSTVKGGIGDDKFLYECPDFFELLVDGDPSNKKWILTAANADYVIGTFDGTKFTPETQKLHGYSGQAFYAAQTFSDMPDGRRIQIGWLQSPSPGMPFNQAMSLPLELKLCVTPEGLRLARQPVKELELLRNESSQSGALVNFRGDLIELCAEFEPGDTGTVEFNFRGVKIAYDAKQKKIIVNGMRGFAPLMDGQQRIRMFADRTALEVFASDGLTYMPVPLIPNHEDQSVSVEVKGEKAKMTSLQIYKLKSIWKTK